MAVERTEEKRLNTIMMLLAKAESTDQPAEKETYFAAAQSMATRAQVDLDMIRARTKDKNARQKPIMRNIEVGSAGDRGAGAYSALLIEIAQANSVELILSNSEADLYGFPADIDLTVALFEVILGQMVQACVQYIDSDTWRGETSLSDARKSFYHGYRTRVGRRLREERDKALAEAERDYAARGQSTALVLRDKQREVRDLYWRDARNYRSFRGSGYGSHSGSRNAGDHAGRSARFQQTREIRG